MRRLDRIHCPVAMAWGDLESPEFKRQGMVFADALLGMGLQRSRATLFNTNHLQVPLQLNRPDHAARPRCAVDDGAGLAA